MTTNCSRRDDAALLNNHGVVCLDRGDTLQAQKLFYEALRCARKELHAPSKNLFSPPIGVEPTYFGTCLGLDKWQEGIHNTPGLLHSQAFPICQRNFSNEPTVDRTICSSIIVFNLALVYHRKGTLEGHQGLVEKARNFYEKSYELLADTGATINATGDLLVDLLCMAMVNNLAYISFDMSDFLRSTEYSNELIRFALSVASSPTIRKDTPISTALDQQKRNFLLNATILRSPSLAPAAWGLHLVWSCYYYQAIMYNIVIGIAAITLHWKNNCTTVLINLFLG